MQQLKDLYCDILQNGNDKETRTGDVISVWDRKIKFDLSQGFPATTSKKLGWQSVVGELLFFLSGKDCISDLKYYTFGNRKADKWTIWTDDAERWGDGNFLGNLYPAQWRRFNDSVIDDQLKTFKYNQEGVDQIQNLITRLQTDPQRRDHIVMAWNPYDIENDLMALKPCHLGFQCYVDNSNRLHLKWWQRSVDSFLGLPFNIASYALLTHLLASWTGLEAGTLTGDLGDVHIYKNHLNAVNEYIENNTHDLPQLVLPQKAAVGLDQVLELTALDFKSALQNYKHEGVIKAPLSVGE